MLRSVRFYSLGTDWPSSEQELSDKLAKAAFKPCGPYVERSSGFEPPVAAQPELFARRVAGTDLMRLRSQVRVLPAGALNEALEARLEEYRAGMQEEPGRGTKRQLNASLYAGMERQLELEADLQQEMAESGDFVEGVTAFVSKRQARFAGN